MVKKPLRILMSILLVKATLPGMAQTTSASLSDRLIVSINSVPYTQRQIEAYASVREALRNARAGEQVIVVVDNWKEAIELFTEEMIVLQEAQRLGGFQAESRLTQRYRQLLDERMRSGPALRATLQRLGYDVNSLGRVVDAILRVASFRRSKERQPGVSGGERNEFQNDGPPAPIGAPTRGGGPWLDDLKTRAVVRHYDGAFHYETIKPPLGSTSHVP